MDLIIDGSPDAFATILLAHGAGAAMDSATMTSLSAALVATGFQVVRFEFAYMAARRTGGRKPPPRAEKLLDEYRAAVAAAPTGRPLVIGGKSLGGRVASMVADDLFVAGHAEGLLCVGYPFHPPGQPEKLRTAHLAALSTPTLVAQGTRDPFGTPAEVGGYGLSDRIEMLWLEDGDHDLKPRKTVSGFTHADHLRTVAEAARDWARRIIRG
ncbi:MAG: alpha/beta fold hydrolase [Phreatobacter sp.]|uniref:alpha/beta fold hydrolase n=1 Tax=Phreatobacter sp. TaxID=1966341 RepID=UPI004035562C